MTIRNTAVSDLARVMEIYARARDFMARTGNPNQWGPTNWPPRSRIEEDIAMGYRDITCGAWANGEPYGVVHRIASDGSEPGVGTFCLKWAYGQCGHLRIDTHPDNKVMQGLLLKLGFVRRGIIDVEEDDNPRYAYEKL